MKIKVKVTDITGEYRTMQAKGRTTYKKVLYSLFDGYGTVIVRFNGKTYEVGFTDIAQAIINSICYREVK